MRNHQDIFARERQAARTINLLATLCLFFAAFAGWTTFLLSEQSDANKAQVRGLVCFDHAGKPTVGTDWQECREVAIREIAR